MEKIQVESRTQYKVAKCQYNKWLNGSHDMLTCQTLASMNWTHQEKTLWCRDPTPHYKLSETSIFDRCCLRLDNKYARLTSSADGGLLEWGFKLLIFNGPRNPEGGSFLVPENVPEVHLSYHRGCLTGPVRSESVHLSEVGSDSDPNWDAQWWRAVLTMPDQENLLAVHILTKERHKVSDVAKCSFYQRPNFGRKYFKYKHNSVAQKLIIIKIIWHFWQNVLYWYWHF